MFNNASAPESETRYLRGVKVITTTTIIIIIIIVIIVIRRRRRKKKKKNNNNKNNNDNNNINNWHRAKLDGILFFVEHPHCVP